MTGLEDGPLPTPLALLVLLVVVLTAGLGAVLRSVVLSLTSVSPSQRVRTLGSAWLNVPATAGAAAALVAQQRLDLLPGQTSAAVALGVVGVIGLCGGLSTYSTLALELSRSLLERRRRDLLLQLAGVATGVLAGLFGAGLAGIVLLLART